MSNLRQPARLQAAVDEFVANLDNGLPESAEDIESARAEGLEPRSETEYARLAEVGKAAVDKFSKSQTT